jgi:hypothetical protein
MRKRKRSGRPRTRGSGRERKETAHVTLNAQASATSEVAPNPIAPGQIDLVLTPRTPVPPGPVQNLTLVLKPRGDRPAAIQKLTTDVMSATAAQAAAQAKVTADLARVRAAGAEVIRQLQAAYSAAFPPTVPATSGPEA